MAHIRLSADQVEAIRAEFVRQGGVVGMRPESRGIILATAKATGVDRGTVYRHCCPRVVEEAPAADIEREEEAGSLRFKFTSDKLIETVEDVIAKVKADMSIWRVAKFNCKGYTVPIRVRQGQDDKGRHLADAPFLKQMWLVSVHFERIQPKPYDDASAAIVARMARHAPKYDRITYETPADPHLLMIGIFDVHFGRLCWRKETGQDYDLAIAETVYRDAVDDLLRASSGYQVDEILLPIGSDLLHVDNAQSTTTAGTFQDTDGRLAKIIETAEASVIWAIERAATVAPVRVVHVPGNHDQVTSYHLARTIAAWFRNHPGVKVDCAPTSRKYHRYGTTLLGITHGDKEKRAELPIIMATERPADWASTTTREFLIGHLHQSKASHSTPVDGQAGVIVRTLRSLAAQDNWHAQMGYLATDRGAEGYLYSHATGYAGHFVARPRAVA